MTETSRCLSSIRLGQGPASRWRRAPGFPPSECRFLTSLDTVTVEGDGEGSIVTDDATLTLNGLLALAEPILGVAFERIGD
jgi:hypothetical protein